MPYTPVHDADVLAVVDWRTGRLLWPPNGDTMMHPEYPPTVGPPSESLSRWTSRKLWAALIGMVLASWLRSRGLLGDDGYVTIMVAGMIGYPLANVAQRAVERDK